MIGHASSDEKGKLSGGIAGDNNKKEVCIRTWYNRPWNVVLICKDATMREKIAAAMQAACENDYIGYDQAQRNTLLTYARPVGYNPALVKMDCECDCSSLVSVCCMYAGISESVLFKANNCCTTSTLRKALMSTGLFDEYTDSKYIASEDYLPRGAILLYEGHHTAICLTDGRYVNITSSPSLISPNYPIGVDVSSYQGIIDWSKVKNAGIKFAALKIIRKDLQKDNQFENNYNGCIKNNIEIKGVYNYSYATTTLKAKNDANMVISHLNGRKLKVWLDVEDDVQKNLGSKLIDIIITYKDTIENAGLEFGVYTGLSFYNTYIKPYISSLNIDFWIARYGGSNNGVFDEKYKPVVNNMVCWQYTSGGTVTGINGRVDMNVWYGKTTTNQPQPQPSKKNLGIVTASSLNIRQLPTTSSKSVGYLSNGTIVEILSTENGWGRIDRGYISLKYVKMIDSQARIGVVYNCTALNIRSTPNSSISNVIKSVPVGTQLTIISDSDINWYQVLLSDNTVGFASKKYIKER